MFLSNINKGIRSVVSARGWRLHSHNPLKFKCCYRRTPRVASLLWLGDCDRTEIYKKTKNKGNHWNNRTTWRRKIKNVTDQASLKILSLFRFGCSDRFASQSIQNIKCFLFFFFKLFLFLVKQKVPEKKGVHFDTHQRKQPNTWNTRDESLKQTFRSSPCLFSF